MFYYNFYLDNGESQRERRKKKLAKRSEEKKRKIKEKVSKANQRWQKYSNIDYELVFFIARYYDQLPLCSNCRSYFIAHQAQFLADDPRASLDYAAESVLRSSRVKSLTMKKAAKARLIKDYNNQTNIIFNLCDNCLSSCEKILNELKYINYTRKVSNDRNLPDSESTTIIKSNLQQDINSTTSSNILNTDNNPFSPIKPRYNSYSHWNPELNDQQSITFNNKVTG